jgi:hypothetical protein
MAEREDFTDREIDELLASATPEERAWLDEMAEDFRAAFAQARADRAERQAPGEPEPEFQV